MFTRNQCPVMVTMGWMYTKGYSVHNPVTKGVPSLRVVNVHLITDLDNEKT